MFDLIIKNVSIIDGNKTDRYIGDVAIENGKIAKISNNILESSKELIDATGLTLTPGFIDSHSHDDFIMDSVPTIYPKLEQGITTVIAGMCGFSLAPVSIDHKQEGYRLYDTIAASGVIKDQKIRGSFKDFLNSLKENYGTSIGFHIGHNTIRTAVMGFENRKPSDDELNRMKEYVKQAMECGALGISFGLFYNPGQYADTKECIELCKVVKEYDGDMTIHIRNENVRVVEAVEETLKIVRATGIRCVISHHKCTLNAWGKCKKTIELIEEANKEGYQVYLDQYPYSAFSTSLNSELPGKYYSLDKKQLLAYLKSEEKRKEIKEEMYKQNSEDYFDKLMISGSPNCKEYAGRMLKDIAEELKMDKVDVILDLLLKDDLATSVVGFAMCEEDIEYIMKYKYTMIGTDGLWYEGAISAHPRAFASFPRVLGYYVKQRKVLSYEETIYRMTYLPAKFYRLNNKGLIKEGYDADMCLLDLDNYEDKANYVNFNKRCTGLKYVFINGEIVCEDGKCNGKLLGQKILRRG